MAVLEESFGFEVSQAHAIPRVSLCLLPEDQILKLLVSAPVPRWPAGYHASHHIADGLTL